jgi:putative transposase
MIDYVTKYCLAITVSTTGRGVTRWPVCVRRSPKLIGCWGLDNLREDRGVIDVVDTEGELIGQVPAPIAIVSDNGSCFRGQVFTQELADQNRTENGEDPLLRHVRTRVKSPQTNGVVERFFGTLKYEHLYRCEIPDGDALAVETNLFRQTCNTIRPRRSRSQSGHRCCRSRHGIGMHASLVV